MVDVKKVTQSLGLFFLGYIYIIIMAYILPILISVLQAIFNNNNDLEGIIWFFTIIIWIMFVIIVPTAKLYDGLTTDTNTNNNKIIIVAMGILMLLIINLLAIKGWYWIEAMATLTSGVEGANLISVLFWVGIGIQYLILGVGTPIYMIIEGTKE